MGRGHLHFNAERPRAAVAGDEGIADILLQAQIARRQGAVIAVSSCLMGDMAKG